MRVAALTMAYNEPVWARVWARHYARQVGAEHCYLLDHGSTDGSTDGLGINVERMPRSPLDEVARTAAVTARSVRLLREYDVVVHSDVDELVFPHPGQFAGLPGFAASCTEPVVTAVGLDLQHIPHEEPALDPFQPLGRQRRWVRFSGSMCKPCLIRRPVAWQPGFHRCELPPVIGPLLLVHLRYADLGAGLRRLARTRALHFTDPAANPHQRVSDAEFEAMVRAIAELPRRAVPLQPDQPPLAGWLARVRAGWSDGSALSLAGDALWELTGAMRASI